MINAYLSMPLIDADHLDWSCEFAANVAEELRENFPQLEVFCPLEHELFTFGRKEGILTDQVYSTMSESIVKLCSVILVGCAQNSIEGTRLCREEVEYALDNGLKVVQFDPKYSTYLDIVRSALDESPISTND